MRSILALLGATILSLALCAPAHGGLGERLGPDVEVDRHEETGKVGFIGARAGAAIESSAPAGASRESAARRFVLDNARAFGLTRAADGLRVRDSYPALARARTVRLQQTVDGVPVLGGELAVNVAPNGDILSVLGETSPAPRVTPEPRIEAVDAALIARSAVAKARRLDASELEASAPRLRVYDPALIDAPDPLGKPRLAWVLEVSAAEPPIRELVVVDAQRGIVALHFDQIAEARSQWVCDENNTPLAKYPCNSALADRTEPPDTEPVAEPDVNLAFDYAADTYDFYFDRFGRDSLDDAGMTLISTVDHCPSAQRCPYENAFWDGSQMAYGDGYASADDVVGHELSHGVTDFSSHLFYYAQSGAINESMSDVFGEFIDLTNGAGDDDAGSRWLIGEDLPTGAIRNMANPPASGDPDRTGSPLYAADPKDADAGGVHTNSGVNNKAAFLITDGGAFNGQTVGGIGIAKAARIYYEANNSMLVSGSDYEDLANALRQACANLAAGGVGGITTADCESVERAVVATEMDETPANAPAPEAPTAAATCAPGTATTVFADDLEDPAGGNWIRQTANPPAYGSHAWFYPQIPNWYGFDATYATSGVLNFWGDDPGNAVAGGAGDPDVTDSSIRTAFPIAIPSNSYLRFRHAFAFHDSAGTGAQEAYDGGVVEYSVNGGATWADLGPMLDANGYTGVLETTFFNPLGGREAFAHKSNGYISTRANLSSLAGRQVLLRFRIGADDSVGDYGWFVDDIEVFSCSGSSDPPDDPPDDPPSPPDESDPPADTRAPSALIQSGPRRRTARRSATFRFTADEPGVTFECALKGRRAKRQLRTFGECTSPRKYRRLKPGTYTFKLRPTDAAGNVGAVAKHRWKVKRRRA